MIFMHIYQWLMIYFYWWLLNLLMIINDGWLLLMIIDNGWLIFIYDC